MNQLKSNFLSAQINNLTQVKIQIPVKQELSPKVAAIYKPISSQQKDKTNVCIWVKNGEDTAYRRCLPNENNLNVNQKYQPKSKKIICKEKVQKVKKRKASTDQQYNIKNQKKDRNVTSNLIHHLIKYLILTKGYEPFLKQLLEKRPKYTITYEQFIAQLTKLNKNLKTYITIGDIQKLWFDEYAENKQFAEVMRVLSRKFFCQNGFLSVYYSNKFNTASKLVHYRGVRSLIWILTRKASKQQMKLI